MGRSTIEAESSQAAAEPAKREAILRAALELFAERTFDGTPVPLIAERADVGAGTIYRYFASKEALVNAVYRRWKGELKRVLVDETPAGLAPREEFGHWWRALWAFASANPRAFSFLEMHHHEAYLDDESRAIGEAVTAGARAFVRRAQRAGDVRKAEPDLLIAMVFGAFTGLVKSGMPATAKAIDDSETCAWALVSAR